MSARPSATTDFDEYAANYDAALAEGVSVSGEDKSYFAAGRVAYLEGCLAKLNVRPGAVMDFGCGTGSGAPFLGAMRGIDALVGVDVSEKSVEIARRLHARNGVRFEVTTTFRPEGRLDLAFCNGVFHHIPLGDRLGAVRYVADSLRPGGLFALWENNPWNPGARLVMSRIPFDRDAIMLSAIEARRLLREAGFEILRTDFLFVFPRALRFLRPLEPLIARAPLGAQYQVLGRKR